MNFVEIKSYKEFITHAKSAKRSYLLLYKSGSESSECALKNIEKARINEQELHLYKADVNIVRDIHDKYNIKSVPSLLEFEGESFKNVVKGCNEASFYSNIFDNIYISNPDNNEKPQPRVTVYSTPTCTWCNTLKSYLKKNHVRFTDIDVSRDQSAAQEMVRRSGQQGVPQTDINGQIIVGFDKTRINNLLGIQG